MRLPGVFREATRDVASGIVAELSEVRLTGDRGLRCTMTAAAVVLATLMALLLRLDDPWWAAISTFVVTQATAPASLQRGVMRIVGTAIGALLALVLCPLMVDDPAAMALALFGASTLGVLGFGISAYGYAWLLGAVTADMVFLSALAAPYSAPQVASYRTAEVVVGTLSAICVAYLFGPSGPKAATATESGWGGLFDHRWPELRHAIHAGLVVMIVPFAWAWLDLPDFSQSAITVAAVVAVPVAPDDATRHRALVARGLHRITGCFLGGILGLLCLALSITNLALWLGLLGCGIWLAAHLQSSRRGIGYVGTQAAVVFICMLIQGSGPPGSFVPGVSRLAGIAGGLVILMIASLLLGPIEQARPDALSQDARRSR
jgi:uncharacterized membrane protein YccC